MGSTQQRQFEALDQSGHLSNHSQGVIVSQPETSGPNSSKHLVLKYNQEFYFLTRICSVFHKEICSPRDVLLVMFQV